MISSIVNRTLNKIIKENKHISLANRLTEGIFTTTALTLNRSCSSKNKESEEDEECEPKTPDCTRDVKDLLSPKCKVALITGGSSGIGFAVATELLCAGAKNVVITGLDACKGKEAANMLNNTFGSTKVLFIKGNCSCTVQLEDAFKKVMSNYKRLDIFVNCAAILDGKQWEKEFVTNVIGTVRGTLLAYKYIGKTGTGNGGAVVNLAGIHGLEPLPAAPTICSCWHAIIGFSRSFGHKSHVTRTGVRICTLCTGFTQTDFIKRISEKGMTEIMGKELEATARSAKKQKADVCGRAVMHLIKKADSGTVWWLEGSRLFSLEFPKKECCSTLEAQYM